MVFSNMVQDNMNKLKEIVLIDKILRVFNQLILSLNVTDAFVTHYALFLGYTDCPTSHFPITNVFSTIFTFLVIGTRFGVPYFIMQQIIKKNREGILVKDKLMLYVLLIVLGIIISMMCFSIYQWMGKTRCVYVPCGI
jgi:hypothetical protein